MPLDTELRNNRIALQETATYYADAVGNVLLRKPNLWKLYEHNVALLPKSLSYYNLDNGKIIIENSEDLIIYTSVFAGHHYHKLQTSFISLFHYLPQNIDVDIIDYGCGQALATIALYDYIIQNLKNVTVENVILIEPSKLALERGILHLNFFIDHLQQNTKLKKINKKINDISSADLVTTENNIKIHLFSNILDLLDFNLETLKNKLTSTNKGINYFVCVSPKNLNAQPRILEFQRYFTHTNIPCPSGTIKGRVFSFAGKTWQDDFSIQMFQRIFRCFL